MNELIEKINNEYKLSGKPEDCINTSNIDMEQREINLIVAQETPKALRNAINKRLTDYFTLKINNGEYDFNETLKNANDYILENAEGKFIKTDMMYITIRPDEKFCSLPLFIKKVEKVVKKVWIKNYLYVYEQVGMDDNSIGKGFHTHILLHHDSDNKKWSEFKNEIANTFKGLLGEKGIDYKNCLKQQAYINFMNYLIGVKDTKKPQKKDKELKQKYDIPFRENNNLQSYYTNNFQFFKEYSLI